MSEGAARTREWPSLSTPRLVLRLAGREDIQAIVACLLENADHLRPYEPRRSPRILTHEHWEAEVALAREEFRRDVSVRLFLFSAAGSSRVVGTANLRGITRGAAHFGHIGYGLAQAEQGKGLMREALQSLIAYAFGPLRLHRLQAAYVPTNERSGRLLRRLGFSVEGYARDYLQIDGRWEDHILTGLVNPAWKSADDDRD